MHMHTNTHTCLKSFLYLYSYKHDHALVPRICAAPNPNDTVLTKSLTVSFQVLPPTFQLPSDKRISEMQVRPKHMRIFAAHANLSLLSTWQDWKNTKKSPKAHWGIQILSNSRNQVGVSLDALECSVVFWISCLFLCSDMRMWYGTRFTGGDISMANLNPHALKMAMTSSVPSRPLAHFKHDMRCPLSAQQLRSPCHHGPS